MNDVESFISGTKWNLPLQAVTYRTSLAPYLSTACLMKFTVQEREKFPQESMVLSQEFYMDDVLSGCDNVTEAFKLQDDLTALLAIVGFQLRKWYWNHTSILVELLTEAQEIFLT